MPNGTGFATLTIANSPVPFNYVGSGATLPLAIGFVPTHVSFKATTISWEWTRGLGFGVAFNTVSPTEQLITTGGVLDILDGSGDATANVGTTSTVIGLLIGTNTIINNGSGQTYYGLCYR
jgi:hypothetical protein